MSNKLKETISLLKKRIPEYLEATEVDSLEQNALYNFLQWLIDQTAEIKALESERMEYLTKASDLHNKIQKIKQRMSHYENKS